MANHNSFTLNLTYFLSTLTAIALLAKPSSIARLLVFALIQMYQAYSEMPDTSNHWVLAAFINLTIVQSYLYLVVKRRSFHIDKAEFLNTFSPLVNLELITLYFFAFFHKLNSGFFDPAASCAVRFLVLQNDYYNLLPTSKDVITLNIYLTILIEALIPILIVLGRTRRWGILLGLVFHCILAYNPLNGFYDFSATVFALYFLLTDASFSAIIKKIYGKLLEGKKLIKERLASFNVLNFTLFAATLIVIMGLVHYYTRTDDYFRHLVWTGYSVTFIILFLLSLKTSRQETQSKVFAGAHYSLYLFPVLVFLNGFCPYLGLKTETSYAMFSNLRTEGGKTNHFLVPVSSQIFNYQKDVVEIISSSDPFFQKLAAEQRQLVYFQFRKYVRKNKVQQVTYLRNGQEFSYARGQSFTTHDLQKKEHPVLEKLMLFRNFYKSEVQGCLH
ncbi:hypothetical protein [Rufibacter latericius]|nr:hypothetical protein [Rufibacter latericius]